MIKIRILRWLFLSVWWLFVVPVLIIGDLLKASWQFLSGDEEKESRWEWVSVGLIAVAALGTTGGYLGWWS